MFSASPQRPRRRWSAEAKARLVEESLKPGANVSAIARQAGLASSQLFGWRRKAIKSSAVTPQRDAARLGFVEVTPTVAHIAPLRAAEAAVRGQDPTVRIAARQEKSAALWLLIALLHLRPKSVAAWLGLFTVDSR
ncbi:transposase [Mesorhizobium sp. M6A.T.Ce.TU.016.01.1.1]|uniref:transposase n=1 Tax=Mesorhizobium sp. M6A.T.Ce.TU.016.01.1.1 TaxID=2496783 RepID=UPI001FE0D1C5|nr:transposase [Mesorhizobium sp. M6A.T.Ce.TU.016.01.1.1]